MNYSLYFQAHVKKELTWMLPATLKYSEHVAFDRAVDKHKGVFEFFVALGLEDVFLDIMQKLEQEGVISNLTKMDNRLR